MTERLHRGQRRSYPRLSARALFGAGFAALLALLAADSWVNHLASLQRTLKLEATEAVRMAETLVHQAWRLETSSGASRPPDTRGKTPGPGSPGADGWSILDLGELELAALIAGLEERLAHPTGFCRLRGPDGRVLLERGTRPALPGFSAAEGGDADGWLEGRSQSALTGLVGVSSVSLGNAVTLWAAGNAAPAALLLAAGLMVLSLFGRLDAALAGQRNASRHARQDALTGLPNRRAFEAAFATLGRASVRDRRALSALFVDIDRFKQINDAHGHAAGDRALRAVAGAIRHSLLRPTDFCCRWGGEEFVVLLPDTDARGALQTAQRVMDRVRRLRPRSADGSQIRLTVSIGIASTPQGAAPGPGLVLDADRAMLEAKRAGRDRWVVWQGPAAPVTRSPATTAPTD